MRTFIVYLLIFFACTAVIYSAVIFFAFPLNYKTDIQNAATAYGVDANLVASVINTESKFRHNAVSHKGAIGLMQIMPATGEFIAAKLNMTEFDLYNPHDNIKMGTYYLSYLIDKFRDTRTALIAYNAGEGNTARWLGLSEKLETSPYPETNAYVEKVLNGINYYRYRI